MGYETENTDEIEFYDIHGTCSYHPREDVLSGVVVWLRYCNYKGDYAKCLPTTCLLIGEIAQ